MARSDREKKPDPPKEPELRILPTQLRIGDRIVDESGDWRVRARPYTTGGGKIVNERAQRVESDAVMIRVWGAHERARVGHRLTPSADVSARPSPVGTDSVSYCPRNVEGRRQAPSRLPGCCDRATAPTRPRAGCNANRSPPLVQRGAVLPPWRFLSTRV